MIKLSDYIAKYLKEHGIEHFFMVSGGGAMHLNDSLGRVIPYTANHHEQASAIAAEGYARVNQKLAVVNVTTGPGGLNCLNGVFGQWTDSAPVLYISGQVKFSTTMASCPDIAIRQLGDQEVDIVSVVRSLTKYAAMVTDANMIKYHLDRAIYEAIHGRFGPVWLDIPMNIQAALIDEEKLSGFVPEKISEPEFDVLDVVQKIKASKRPIIVAGHGIRLSGQIDNFHDLVRKSQIPVVTTFNGMDLIETDNPFYVGRIGSVGQRASNFALQNADLVLCLGTRNNIRQVSYDWENFAKNAYKIVIDIDKGELEKPLVRPDMAICADLKDLIPALLNSITAEDALDKSKEWIEFCRRLKDKYSFENHPEQQQKSDVINPYHFTYALTKALQEDDIFVMANGSACVCTFQNAVIKKGQRYILNSGNASMGYGLPAALGACYQAGDRNVVCLEGDGSIMMNLQELQTVAFNKLPLKLFVINNNGYSSIRQTQRNFFNGHMTGSGTDSGVNVPDFVKIGQAFGLETRRISDPATMEREIREVLDTKGAVLCEVMTEQEYAFLPKLSAKKLPDGTMISPSLENMFPFLDEKEYRENML